MTERGILLPDFEQSYDVVAQDLQASQLLRNIDLVNEDIYTSPKPSTYELDKMTAILEQIAGSNNTAVAAPMTINENDSITDQPLVILGRILYLTKRPGNITTLHSPRHPLMNAFTLVLFPNDYSRAAAIQAADLWQNGGREYYERLDPDTLRGQVLYRVANLATGVIFRDDFEGLQKGQRVFDPTLRRTRMILNSMQ